MHVFMPEIPTDFSFVQSTECVLANPTSLVFVLVSLELSPKDAQHTERALFGENEWSLWGDLVGPVPVLPFYPFLGEGFPTKIDYRKKGTLILTSLLEDRVW